jgi:hypothetical protein
MQQRFPWLDFRASDVVRFLEDDVPFTPIDISKETHLDFRADVVMSFDCLEHIDYDDIDTAVSNLQSMAPIALVSVSNHSARSGGVQLHLIQQDGEWWKNLFSKHYDSVSYTTTNNGLTFCFVLSNEPEYSLVVPSSQPLPLTLLLKSFAKAGALTNAELIVVDDSFNLEVKQLVESVGVCKAYYLPFEPQFIENVGLRHTESLLKGIDLSSSRKIIVTHDDVELRDVMGLNEILSAIDDPSVGLAGPFLSRGYARDKPHMKCADHIASCFSAVRKEFLFDAGSFVELSKVPWRNKAKLLKKRGDFSFDYYFEPWAWLTYFAITSEKWSAAPMVDTAFFPDKVAHYGCVTTLRHFMEANGVDDNERFKHAKAFELKEFNLNKNLKKYEHVPLG